MKTLLIAIFILAQFLTLKAQTREKTNTTHESATVTITNSDDHYSLTAVFGKNKMEKLKKIIVKELGIPSEGDKNLSLWNAKNSYMVTLKIQKLNIEMNKEKASPDLIKAFERMGKEIKKSVSETTSVTVNPQSGITLSINFLSQILCR
ncbi:hypothetical protein [Pedobacter sp. NJ-S-72]